MNKAMLVCFLTAISTNCLALDRINKHISGVWRSDKNEFIIIQPRGTINSSLNNFSGLIDQVGENIIVLSYSANRPTEKCTYKIVPISHYGVDWHLEEKSSVDTYCPNGVFYAVRDIIDLPQ